MEGPHALGVRWSLNPNLPFETEALGDLRMGRREHNQTACPRVGATQLPGKEGRTETSAGWSIPRGLEAWQRQVQRWECLALTSQFQIPF